MTSCKPAPTPFLSGVCLEDGGDTPLVDITLYRQLVGSLLYLTHSRPDLSYAVGAISRYMQEPHELHWKAAKRILRYVQGTITFGIHYAADNAFNLLGFTDFDWAGDNIDRKSTSGYSLSVGSGPICWSSKKQATIALSSAKAEDPVQRQWTKHIEIHMHYIRDLVHDRVIDLQFCPLAEQTADIFTKTFTAQKFHSLPDRLGVKDTVA
eukprot:PITA_14095